jgi:hypothetical protein
VNLEIFRRFKIKIELKKKWFRVDDVIVVVVVGFKY